MAKVNAQVIRTEREIEAQRRELEEKEAIIG
jgi:hypothetical protein